MLFEDQGAPHTAGASRPLAPEASSAGQWRPRARPELQAMDQLWKPGKGDALAHRPTRSIDASAHAACRYILAMGGHERLRRAGVLSGSFWLKV